jgi:hypothetical protein
MCSRLNICCPQNGRRKQISPLGLVSPTVREWLRTCGERRRLGGCPVLWTEHLARFYRRRRTGTGLSAFLRTFGGQRFSAKPFTHMARLHSYMNGSRRRCHSWPYLDILADSFTTQMQAARLGMMRTAYKYRWYNLNDRYIGLTSLRQMGWGCKVDTPAS